MYFLVFLAFAGFFYSTYLFITTKEILFLLPLFYYTSLASLISTYLYTKKQMFLSHALIVSFVGSVFLLIKGSFFLIVFSIIFFITAIYILINTPRENVLRYPHPTLRKKATKVNAIDKELIEKMKEIVEKEDGAGLAAPQIGVSKKVIVARLDDKIFTFINPKITYIGTEKVVSNEGCLSVKGVWIDVERHFKIMIEYENEEGEMVVAEVEGILSIIIQHEADHLEGVLIIDHLPFKRRVKEILKYYIREFLW